MVVNPEKNLFGVPPKLSTRLRFTEVLNMQSATGKQNFQYSLNSLYDPYMGAGGSNYSGYGALATLYSRYRVDSVDVTIQFFAVAANATTGLIAGCVPIPTWSNGTPTINSSLCEVNGAASCFVPANPGQFYPERTIRVRYDNSRIEGVNPRVWKSDQDFSAQSTTNPVKQVSLIVFACEATDTVTTISYRARLLFEAHCEFSGPQPIDNL